MQCEGSYLHPICRGRVSSEWFPSQYVHLHPEPGQYQLPYFPLSSPWITNNWRSLIHSRITPQWYKLVYNIMKCVFKCHKELSPDSVLFTTVKSTAQFYWRSITEVPFAQLTLQTNHRALEIQALKVVF
jgi:hypothetical protein